MNVITKRAGEDLLPKEILNVRRIIATSIESQSADELRLSRRLSRVLLSESATMMFPDESIAISDGRWQVLPQIAIVDKKLISTAIMGTVIIRNKNEVIKGTR